MLLMLESQQFLHSLHLPPFSNDLQVANDLLVVTVLVFLNPLLAPLSTIKPETLTLDYLENLHRFYYIHGLDLLL